MKIKNKKLGIKNQEIKQAILGSLNLSNLTKVQQNKIVSILLDSILSRINIAVWRKLSEKDKDELKKIAKSKHGNFLDYINSNVEDFPKLVESITRETINDFKQKRVKL